MEKIKLFINDTLQSEKGKDVLIVIIVILVGLGCFELGRLSKEDQNRGIKVLSSSNEANTDQNTQTSQNGSASVISAVNSIKNTNNTNSSGKNFFASSRGSKYYTISCSAGKSIKQENRIYFMTGEEAVHAGYTLSSACQ